MFWLICPWLVCLPAFVLCVRVLSETDLYTCTRTPFLYTCVYTALGGKHKLETERSPSAGLGRVWTRKAGFPLRKCCSSLLSINTGKETQRKCPRLTISTVNTRTYTYSTALSVSLFLPSQAEGHIFSQRYLQYDRVCSAENHIYVNLCTLFLRACNVLMLSCEVYFYFVSKFATLIATLLSLEVKQKVRICLFALCRWGATELPLRIE